ncbi:HAD family hydrolase [Nonomuraea spiralis]|uniref:HAD family hydrolase n=1 Tax=Nonomuraea spiralis TaxID=46182 RepID=A0ABV5IGB9_9ACTN|nr:HAD family phosphatase [Nonomuraea spiralis]GGS99127.1 hydrolase [Nonomuraea spiralis]
MPEAFAGAVPFDAVLFDAVLFDMDGTLVDTEGLWWQAVAAVARSLGRPLTAADAPYVTGRAVGDTAAHLVAAPDGLGVREVAGALTEAFAERVRAGLTVVPGAPELLAELAAAAVPTALVTASPRGIVELVLPRLGHTFDLVIADGDTARGKPHPEPYLEAARRLRVAPARCVAVEDSPAGVAAATAAGCRVLVVDPGHGLARVRASLRGAPPHGG